MADRVASAIAARLHATEPDPAELEAGRELVLELLDLYVTSMEQHVAFHEAHELEKFAQTARARLEVAVAARQRFEEGKL